MDFCAVSVTYDLGAVCAKDGTRKKRNCSLSEPPRCFECQFCGKFFKQKAVLARHVRRHTGEKPFKCTVCPLAFPRKSTLTYHMANRHPETPLSDIPYLPFTYS